MHADQEAVIRMMNENTRLPVELDKANRAPAIDFDKPFNEQSPEAKAALERLVTKRPTDR